MYVAEKNAQQILADWVLRCRNGNSSGKIELKDVSNWAEKRLEINKNCPGLDSAHGVLIFLCLGSLLSTGGGNYEARVTELKRRYDNLITRRFDLPCKGRKVSLERIKRFTALDQQVKYLVQNFGPKQFLRRWWQSRKEEYHGNIEESARSVLREINGWIYNWRNRKDHLFTVKTFWVTRELHANRVWADFPVKYCCVPDGYVKDVLAELHGLEKYKQLFKIRYSDPRFDLDSSILMSENVWELISTKTIDGYFPYDMPFFRKGYETRA